LAGGYFFWQQKFNDNQTEAASKDDYQRVSSVSNISKITNKKKSDFSKLSVNSKMKLAEKYQKEYERNANALLKKMAADHLTPKKAMKYCDQLSSISSDCYNKFNSLGMPCPSTVGKTGYSTWANKHKQKNIEISDRVDARRDKLLSKVKGLNYISQNP
jgi:hypothetical protein